jgi:hypothetical protein
VAVDPLLLFYPVFYLILDPIADDCALQSILDVFQIRDPQHEEVENEVSREEPNSDLTPLFILESVEDPILELVIDEKVPKV